MRVSKVLVGLRRGRDRLRYFFGAVLAVLFLSGCILIKVPVETVKAAGIIFKTTGQVAGAVGGGVGMTVKAAEKCASSGGHLVEATIQAKAAKAIIPAVSVP